MSTSRALSSSALVAEHVFAELQSTDHSDLDEVPEAVASATAAAAGNATHLARLIRESRYPAYK